MIELDAHGRSLPEAYHKALKNLQGWGTVVEDASHHTRCRECAMTMVVLEPLREPMISRCVPCGAADLEQYRLEMLDGIMDFCVGHGWDYTYHDRMTRWTAGDGDCDCAYYVNQISKAVEDLRQNPTSRRAVIDVRNNGEDIDSDDPACLQHIQYFIRDGKLDCSVLFRSNDAVKATFMNAFALIMLQKRIADKLGVEVGTYTHRANSFHAYERDWQLLKSYVERIYNGIDLTYDFVGDWDEQMREARPEILRKVEELRDRKG